MREVSETIKKKGARGEEESESHFIYIRDAQVAKADIPSHRRSIVELVDIEPDISRFYLSRQHVDLHGVIIRARHMFI